MSDSLVRRAYQSRFLVSCIASFCLRICELELYKSSLSTVLSGSLIHIQFSHDYLQQSEKHVQDLHAYTRAEAAEQDEQW